MLLCVIVAASSMSVSAKKWRVFFDANLGRGLVDHWGYEKEFGFGAMALLSSGYQLNKAFVGGGIGFAHSGEYDTLPVFFQFRYDFFKKNPKAFSPFVSCRLGYSIGVNNLYYSNEGIFVFPSVGFRKGLSNRLGLNLGLSGGVYGRLECYDTDIWGTFVNIGIDF